MPGSLQSMQAPAAQLQGHQVMRWQADKSSLIVIACRQASYEVADQKQQ